MKEDTYVDMARINLPELSEKWECWLFGSTPPNGFIYTPVAGKVPNAFIRFMMRICLGCRWVKKEEL
jgi:hypothetical protein